MEARKRVLSAEKEGILLHHPQINLAGHFLSHVRQFLVISIPFYKFSFTSGIQRKETCMILFNPPHGFLLNLQIALKRRF